MMRPSNRESRRNVVVVDAYDLTRGHYTHILITFSHDSYPDAPRQCLSAFDELQSLRLEAFTQRHDPYWNIPRNENLPQLVFAEQPMAMAQNETLKTTR
jgi:hypothetical protein